VVHGPALKLSTELFIVDASPTAALALRAHRPTEEATYVLCRAASELGAEFARRVLRRACQIRKYRSIECLWFVVGSARLEPLGSRLLLVSLLPLVEAGGSVMVAGPQSQSGALLTWLDELRAHPPAAIHLQAKLFPDASESSGAAGSGSVRAEHPSSVESAAFASENRTHPSLLGVAI
jgi:hypothetical protein